jgi:plasmid stabilization system protein ParE
MRYEFHAEALTEFKDAARYYAKRQPGLDLRYIEAVEHALQQIANHYSRTTFGGVLPGYFLTLSFTPSKPTTFL